jgi:hypothetical protein
MCSSERPKCTTVQRTGPACSECGSNYVQYGRTDYICSGFHNGSTCSNGMRFRIAEIE